MIDLRVQHPLRQRLLQLIQQAVLGKGRLGVRPGQQLIQQLIGNMRLFASCHTMSLCFHRHGPYTKFPILLPPLQRAQHTVGKPARMLPLQSLQNGGAAQMRDRPQQRNDLLRPDSCERVRTGPLAPDARSLAGQNRVAFQPPRRPFTEPRFRRRNRLRGAQSTLLHVPPHLAVGDRHSWHQASPAIAGGSLITPTTNRPS